ncbi:MAG: hypothetical protein LC642_06690 [Verrucomicrobiaceae bacterium]|nr:hypothetical protein [Verrucomicrobiaceae bacterium]
MDKALVKGTTRPLELLEVRHPYSPKDFEEIVARYNTAFADYERGDFIAAERLFAALAEENHDKPSALMAERCGELAADPPKQWNGIYQLKTK